MLDLTAFDDGFDALSRHLPYDCFVWPGVVLLEEDASLMAVVEYQGRDQDGMDPAEVQQTTLAVAKRPLPPSPAAGASTSSCTSAWTGAIRAAPARTRYPSCSIPSAGPGSTDPASSSRTRTLMAVTWTPSAVRAQKLARWFMRNPPEARRFGRDARPCRAVPPADGPAHGTARPGGRLGQAAGRRRAHDLPARLCLAGPPGAGQGPRHPGLSLEGGAGRHRLRPRLLSGLEQRWRRALALVRAVDRRPIPRPATRGC